MSLHCVTVVQDMEVVKEKGEEEYYVMHGNHRLDRKLAWYVIGAGIVDPSVVIYCGIRANDMASE